MKKDLKIKEVIASVVGMLILLLILVVFPSVMIVLILGAGIDLQQLVTVTQRDGGSNDIPFAIALIGLVFTILLGSTLLIIEIAKLYRKIRHTV